MGLYSLYSHLSSISVDVGQMLERGEYLGRTGTSGMAGGDHLHFEMIVNGISVNPDQWFDQLWVKNNIEDPLLEFSGDDNE